MTQEEKDQKQSDAVDFAEYLAKERSAYVYNDELKIWTWIYANQQPDLTTQELYQQFQTSKTK